MADEAEVQEEGKSSGGGLLPIINLVLLVLVLAVGGFVAWKMIAMDQTPPAVEEGVSQTEETKIPEAENDDPKAPPVYMDIDDITVNMADEDRERFLRAKIKLWVRNEAAQVKIEAEMFKINDMVITIFSSKKFSEVRTPQGKYALKEDLKYRINQLVGGKPVKDIFFTDFVSQ
ncbi:MAG: flagellar basal body-associated FliL family protein [Mariprofundaceae bacterium]